LADAVLGMQGAILGFSVSAIFLSAQYTKLFWLLLAVTAAADGLLPREAAAADVAEPAPRLGTDLWEVVGDV
jgi:hypothetical protein